MERLDGAEPLEEGWARMSRGPAQCTPGPPAAQGSAPAFLEGGHRLGGLEAETNPGLGPSYWPLGGTPDSTPIKPASRS